MKKLLTIEEIEKISLSPEIYIREMSPHNSTV